jgi:hypothetical protein
MHTPETAVRLSAHSEFLTRRGLDMRRSPGPSPCPLTGACSRRVPISSWPRKSPARGRASPRTVARPRESMDCAAARHPGAFSVDRPRTSITIVLRCGIWQLTRSGSFGVHLWCGRPAPRLALREGAIPSAGRSGPIPKIQCSSPRRCRRAAPRR